MVKLICGAACALAILFLAACATVESTPSHEPAAVPTSDAQIAAILQPTEVADPLPTTRLVDDPQPVPDGDSGSNDSTEPVAEPDTWPKSLPATGSRTGYTSLPTETPSLQQQDEGSERVWDAVWPGLSSLPACDGSTQLTVPPLAGDAYEAIIPLGLLTTPQHILPTAHIYYYLVPGPFADGVYGPPLEAEVVAPGNIRVLGINVTESTGGPQGDYTDYDITFAPCRDMVYQLIHVSTLSLELEQLYLATEPTSCNEYGDATRRIRFCESDVNSDIGVGASLGTTGGKVSSALDLEAWDLAAEPLAFANPDRYAGRDANKRLQVVCHFDGFTPEVRAGQLARMGEFRGRSRSQEPVCGEVMQDIPGTAQGAWFTEDYRGLSSWSEELAFVHDHIDPTMAAISIGGVVTGQGVWLFTPEPTGLINRDFSLVRADGQIYCHEGAIAAEGGRGSMPFPGRLLVSLTSDTEILVEQQAGVCEDDPSFDSPVRYFR